MRAAIYVMKAAPPREGITDGEENVRRYGQLFKFPYTDLQFNFIGQRYTPAGRWEIFARFRMKFPGKLKF